MDGVPRWKPGVDAVEDGETQPVVDSMPVVDTSVVSMVRMVPTWGSQTWLSWVGLWSFLLLSKERLLEILTRCSVWMGGKTKMRTRTMEGSG